jgi:hypothetical protein
MKVKSEKKARLTPLLFAIGAALALEFAGCKEGAGGAATTEPSGGAAGTATNSAATNASASVDTNTTAAAPSQ